MYSLDHDLATTNHILPCIQPGCQLSIALLPVISHFPQYCTVPILQSHVFTTTPTSTFALIVLRNCYTRSIAASKSVLHWSALLSPHSDWTPPSWTFSCNSSPPSTDLHIHDDGHRLLKALCAGWYRFGSRHSRVCHSVSIFQRPPNSPL